MIDSPCREIGFIGHESTRIRVTRLKSSMFGISGPGESLPPALTRLTFAGKKRFGRCWKEIIDRN